jgi:hypothetical protein
LSGEKEEEEEIKRAEKRVLYLTKRAKTLFTSGLTDLALLDVREALSLDTSNSQVKVCVCEFS